MTSDPKSDSKHARDELEYQSPPSNMEVDPSLKNHDVEITVNFNPTTETTQTHRTPATSRPIKSVYEDFSLQSGSASEVRFRTRNVSRDFKIYNQPNAQLILEEIEDTMEVGGGDGDLGRDVAQDRKEGKGIRIRQTYDTSYGLQFLRAIYSLIAVFVGGFLFILGICILLFLFIDLATQLGITSNQSVSEAGFLAVLLSIPVLVYSLAMGMTLMTRFVVDTFYGHPFLRTFGLDLVTMDWIAFVMYLCIPLVAMIGTLFMQKTDWWEISLLTWFCSVLIFWGAFSSCVLWYEVKECLDLIVDVEDDLTEDDNWSVKIRRTIVHGMTTRLSGTKLLYRKSLNADDGNVEDTLDGKNRHPEGLWTLLTKWKYLSCLFSEVDPPKRIYSLDETRGSVSFVTRTSWSLEKLFCRRGGVLGAVPITSGHYGITKSQINSTIACRILGQFLYVMILAGVAVWFGMDGGALAILLFVLLLFFTIGSMTTYRMLDVRLDIIHQRNVFRYWTKYRVTTPSVAFTWVFICFEIVVFYFVPLLNLFLVKNISSALVFGIFGLFSALRHYLNAQTLLEEIGPNHFSHLHQHSESAEWKKKQRFYQIAEIGADNARWFWIYTFVAFVVFFVFVVLLAAYDSKTGAVTEENYGFYPDILHLMSDFEYEPQPYLPYPTCALKKGLNGVTFDTSGLSNFAFLAGIAYAYENQTQTYLNQWFGVNNVINDVDTVNEFKRVQALGRGVFSNSAVAYRLFTFADKESVLSIRGTSTVWDLMSDAQLWLSATLFQALRVVLPLGNLFTPILHHTVKYVSFLESSNIEKVAFYKETADFVRYLKARGYNVLVTGHSLGGGLALITGSQTGIPAIGMSAPNSMLSRDTFDPPLTVEQLDTLTFNVVPARDIIPMVDDKARLYQNINCTAPDNEFPDCHSITRTLCEIQYSCGSGDRPVPCECVIDYNYPEPIYTGNGTSERNFTQVCLDAMGDK
ncbi:hypothetical protein HJC23_012603 [Cyclotella cryptica]|uniref:Fungal lipase-type domain-containing protein n=1 Tax=Cyclotella cryptica TaxID=29204 RepID=A0ABD3QLA4_9STRA